MRYQGDQAVSGEAELRWQFHERWSAVAFGGAGATRTDQRRDVLRQSVGSGGAGFRYELARKFGQNRPRPGAAVQRQPTRAGGAAPKAARKSGRMV